MQHAAAAAADPDEFPVDVTEEVRKRKGRQRCCNREGEYLINYFPFLPFSSPSFSHTHLVYSLTHSFSYPSSSPPIRIPQFLPLDDLPEDKNIDLRNDMPVVQKEREKEGERDNI